MNFDPGMCYLVLPLKLRPHCSEFCVSTDSWYDIVHYIYVYVIEYHHVTITHCSGNIVNCGMNK